MKTHLTKIAYAFTVLLALSNAGFSGETPKTMIATKGQGALRTFLEKHNISYDKLLDIKYLRLQRKSIEDLPDSLGDLGNLEDLYVMGNRLKTLPETIGKLTKLDLLNVSRNQLTELPKSIVTLTNLQTLVLSHNQLTALPENIGELDELRSLDISGNPIKELPDSVSKLEELETIRMPKSIKNQQILIDLEELETITLHDDAGKEVESYFGEDEVQEYLSQFQGSFTKGAQ